MKNKTRRIFARISVGLFILVFFSACSLESAPPANSSPTIVISTGQSSGLVPADQYTPESGEASNFDLSGPQAWVEFPKSGAMLPPGTEVMLEVYASDPTGIKNIQIKVDGRELPNKAPVSVAADGSARLVKVEQYFLDGYKEIVFVEGQHTVEVVAININGISSPINTTIFCRGKCYDNRFYTPPAPPSIRNITPTSTATEITEITIVDFYFHPHSNPAGDCPTLVWEVSGTEEGVYIDGELVPAVGSRKHCACETEYHTLKVITPDGKNLVRQAELYVNEGTTCDPQTNITPPSPQEYEPPAESVPYISIGDLIWGDCKFFGHSIIDSRAGISQAKFGYNLNNQGWSWVWMSRNDNDNRSWLSDAGISVMDGINTPTGHIDVQIWVMDSYGNEIYSEIKGFDYAGCSG